MRLKIHSAKGLLGLTSHGLPVAEFLGKPRVLGCLPPRPFVNFPDWNSQRGLKLRGTRAGVAQDQWQERDWRPLVDKVLDLKQTAASVPFAARQAFNIAFQLNGRSQETFDFDPLFVYGLVNNGVDGGAVISDVLDAMTQTGICVVGDIPAGSMFKTEFPQSAYDSAKRFRIAKALKLNSFEEICSAISSGWQSVFSLMIGQNFADVDDEGVSPPADVIRGNHGLCDAGLTRINSGQWAVRALNSWTKSFGVDGYCLLTAQSFGQVVDAFAIQVVTPDSSSGPPPVVTKLRAQSEQRKQRAGRSGKSTRAFAA